MPMDATLTDCFWRKSGQNHVHKRKVWQLICPIIFNGERHRLYHCLGEIRQTNDGRYKWQCNVIKNIPPDTWKNLHEQGTSLTLDHAALSVESGFSYIMTGPPSPSVAYHEGVKAFEEGQPRTANPYLNTNDNKSGEDKLWRAWYRGYDRAFASDYKPGSILLLESDNGKG